MTWWGWVTIGALLLVAELAIVDLEFYLVFLGTAALITGLAVLSGLAIPGWGQWLLFAGLAAGSLLLFRGAVYQRLRPPPDGHVDEGVAGAIATADAEIPVGATGPVSLRGTGWTGRNVGTSAIAAGARCRVERSDGLTLEVRTDD